VTRAIGGDRVVLDLAAALRRAFGGASGRTARGAVIVDPGAASRDPDPFPARCEAAGLPRPVAEFRFAAPRRWRFDWAWVAERVALEVEGSVPGHGGRHRQYRGWLADMEKYTTAAAMGWLVLRCTPRTRDTDETMATIRAALTHREKRDA
jgi:hypothetical protein